MTTSDRARRVFLVDDDSAVRQFAERVRQQAGYDVTIAANGRSALKVLEEQWPFDLCVIDLVMPDMTGDELAARLRKMHPDAKVLYFTGFSDRLFQQKPTLWEHEAFLEKPVK